MKAVVLFFSVSSHTADVAKIIASEGGFDVIAINPKAPYPLDVNELEKRVMYEQDEKLLPCINLDERLLDKYSHLFIGSPVWFGQVAAPVHTLIRKLDLRGRTVHPFVTSGGMQDMSVGKFIDELSGKGAAVTTPLVVKYSHKGRMGNDEVIRRWVRTHMNKYHIS